MCVLLTAAVFALHSSQTCVLFSNLLDCVEATSVKLSCVTVTERQAFLLNRNQGSEATCSVESRRTMCVSAESLPVTPLPDL